MSGLEAPNSHNSLQDALDSIGEGLRISARKSLSGGDINRAWKLALTNGSSLFLKENSRKNLPFFSAECAALREMAPRGEGRVVEPLAIGVEGENSFLLLPFLERGNPDGGDWREFGSLLARFHRNGRGDRYGFSGDNFIGSTPQCNRWREGWVDFFRENRLEYQIRLAADYLDGSLSRRILRFLDRLESYLPEPDYPSLLHGDLWSGNVLPGPEGELYLIDPAAYYGNREADLAMTGLFGRFPGDFYRAYGEEWPLEPDYSDRADIYNLYHLLNHLNMFGPSYLGAVRSIVERFS